MIGRDAMAKQMVQRVDVADLDVVKALAAGLAEIERAQAAALEDLADAEGYDHHYYHPARMVVVYDGRDLDDVIYIGESTVRSYEEWVTNFRSWARKGQFRDMALHYERAER